ncbi:MAG TPA: choice-of-anchor Q domain-containing protein [Chitinophagaceae bacterium]|nr:choice-of-anchor Q domain-containing protein [Chitinophagaceae bacterium]
MKQIAYISLCSFFVFIIDSCKKEKLLTNGNAAIIINRDTLNFDTVFTSTGSITQYFTIINPNNQKIQLSSIRLMGGNTSPFKINADGINGPTINNIEIEANDSIYVFVLVTINPNTASLPFVINDSIQINWNGNTLSKHLQAWGQNAHFLRNKVINVNTIWENDLPYVILGGIRVDTNINLTINPGVRIYSHADAPFIVDGTLTINGTKQDSVIFRGDRLDEDYRDFPGSWPGIYFRDQSKDNQFTYVIIKNAFQGIVVQNPSPNANPKVTLSQCIIDNIYDAGILGIQSSIKADNCLISNCGSNVAVALGGNYSFTHCTIATYSSSFINHKNPVLFASNALKQNNQTLTNNLFANFTNCIIWGEGGSVEDEVVTDKQGNNTYSVTFDNVLYKVKTDPANIVINASIKNQPPVFDSIDVGTRFYDFHLKAASPAINKGKTTGLAIDLDGRPRANGLPDLGCYEKQ